MPRGSARRLYRGRKRRSKNSPEAHGRRKGTEFVFIFFGFWSWFCSCRDPAPKFDRTKVKGRVAERVELKKPGTATAIEAAAGGALYNVMVDTDKTGQLLLQARGAALPRLACPTPPSFLVPGYSLERVSGFVERSC